MIELDLAQELLTKNGGGFYEKGGVYLWKKNQNHFSHRIERAIISISHKYPFSKVFEIQLQKQIYIPLSPSKSPSKMSLLLLSSEKNKILPIYSVKLL